MRSSILRWGLLLLYERQLDIAGVIRCVIDALLGFLVVGGFGEHDVGDEGLRIAVVEREPGGLYLHHDAVAGQEYVIRGGQIELIGKRRVGLNRFGDGETFTIAAAQDVSRNHELEATEVRV